MEFSEFLRIFEVRGSNLMWFLGAGCSISSGIPLASDIIWDCKSRIYCSEQGIPRSRVADISNPQIQSIIQDYLNSKSIVPRTTSDGDEYTYYFQKAIASKSDRQVYIKDLMLKATPSYGHLVLAALASISLAPIVWTTNFDKLFENAIYEVYKTTNNLIVADLGEPNKATQALNDKSFPLLVKLHGDFHSELLKNTQPELQSQDEQMRLALKKACSGYGLCVMGYSGRDDSVMQALKDAASIKGSFPHGIFWFLRPGTKALPSVLDLFKTAKDNGIEAHFVETNNFDETLDGIRRYLGAFPKNIEDLLEPKSSRKTEALLKPPASRAPYLRLNALRIDSSPSMCKVIVCDIGGSKEVEKAIEETQANILASRVKKGVIAFGADAEIRKAFRGYGIKSIEIFPINPSKLSFVSGEYRLVYDALCKGISRQTGLSIINKRSQKFLLADAKITPPSLFNQLNPDSVGALSGIVPSTTVKWQEACKIDLNYCFDKLWILLSPRVLLTFPEDATEAEKNKAKTFAKERTAPRFQESTGRYVGYNIIAASILSGWMSILSKNTNTERAVFSAFGTGDGLDAEFEITTARVVSGRTT